MTRRPKRPDRSYVNHPRFGNQPIPSGGKHGKAEIERSHWRYRSVEYFPETAIEADTRKQNYALYPRSLYVDIAEHCEICRRPFIFFAREQQYWFETLGFWVDAHCTRCTDCRRKDREIRTMQRKYQSLADKSDRSRAESREFKRVALELYQLGYIRDTDKVDRIELD